MNEVLHVQLVEDDCHIRTRLLNAIDAHAKLRVCAHADTLMEAERQLLARRPDVLLVDLGLPDGDGTDLIRQATRCYGEDTRSIVFSVFGDEQRVLRAIEAGASGYLLKDTGVATLADSIIELAEGKSPISPGIASHLLKRFRPLMPNHDVQLSERERQILEYIARGFTNREIAGFLGISYYTVISHTKKIYRKLQVTSRTEAVFEAGQIGLVHIR